MAVKLNVQANVTGQQQLLRLNAGLKSLGNQSLIAKKKLAALEAGAARAKATMTGLGTALKVGVVAGFAAAGFAAVSFVKSTFKAGNMMESAQIQFKAFFGSAEAGAEAFKLLNEYASTVPFSIDEIIQGSTALAAISDGPEDLGKQLQIVGNLAAAANLSFSDAALQYQKVASAGIAAADLLRDRGVKALLGFTEGVRYTAEESIAVFEENYSKNGRFGKVAGELAGTLKGSASMVQDFYIQLNAAAAKPLFLGLTKQINELVGDFKNNDAELKRLAERIGESLAVGFGNLGKFIKLVVDNFDTLIKAIKLFLTLKILGFVGNIGKAMLLMAGNIKVAEVSMYALGKAFRVNPIGIIITALQIGSTAWILFGDQIKAVVNYIKDKFLKIMNQADIIVRTFWETLGIGNEDNLTELNKAKIAVEGLAASYTKLTKAQKGAFSDVNMDRRTSKTRTFADVPNPRGDMLASELERIKISQEKELAESFKTKFRMRLENGSGYSGSDAIDGDKPGVKNDAHVKLHALKLKQIKEYRAQLSLVGIDSQKIGGIIGDTWLQGIKEGNSLLETTKNAFKNVLVSISDTIVKRSAELLVERIFNSLIDQRIMKQKTLNAATSEQGNIMTSLISKAGSLFSMGSSGGGIGSKIGGLFGSLFGGGGGGSNLMGIGSAKGFFGMNKGGVVPGGAPYTDRVPTMLTPGEVVIPRNKVGQQSGNTNITNINISGNVDDRAISQIKMVIAQSSAEVGGANRSFGRNTAGLRGRG